MRACSGSILLARFHVAAFEDAVNLAHWEPRPHLHLSRIYRALGRAEPAQRQQQHFDRLQALAQRAKRYQLQVEAYPEDARAHSNLAMAYGEQGRLDEALDYFRRAIDIDPHYGRAHYGMATVFYHRNELDQAIYSYQQACRFAPESMESFNDLGRAYHRAKQYDKAVAVYKKR